MNYAIHNHVWWSTHLCTVLHISNLNKVHWCDTGIIIPNPWMHDCSKKGENMRVGQLGSMIVVIVVVFRWCGEGKAREKEASYVFNL